MACSVTLPESPLPWWTSSKAALWNDLAQSPGTDDSGLLLDYTTMEDWQRIFSSTLSLPTANWELCEPIVLPSPASSPTTMKVHGRITQVDFPKNELKIALHPKTKIALLNAYDHMMKAKGNGSILADERVLQKAHMRRNLDALVVSLACSALVCTTGSTGAGSFVSYKHAKSNDASSIPEPKLDLCLGQGKFAGRGLPDMIKSLFTIPPTSNLSSPAAAVSPQNLVVRKTSLTRRQLDMSESTMEDTEMAGTADVAETPMEDTYFEAMSDERRAWAEYRVQSSPSKAKRPKSAKPTSKKRKSTTTSATTPTVPSQPASPTQPRVYRSANIYEDSRGGKCRRSSLDMGRIRSPNDLDVIHTDISEIEARLRKQRITPEVGYNYASSDSGLGLMSPPGGSSRYSKTPELEMGMATMTHCIKPSDLSRDATFNADWILKQEFSMGADYDSSSDEDSPSYTKKTKRRLPPAESSFFDLPRAESALPKPTGFLSRKRKSVLRVRKASVLPRTLEDEDYTDASDLELDSDTPLHELMVDSEDEEEHVRRKLARRQRKRVKRAQIFANALPLIC